MVGQKGGPGMGWLGRHDFDTRDACAVIYGSGSGYDGSLREGVWRSDTVVLGGGAGLDPSYPT